jgi:lysophospholipase L1-like esterase
MQGTGNSMERVKKIVFIGDSLTEYFDWQYRFPEYDVKNLGIAGETAEELLGRMGTVRLFLSNPDVIFVMTGANNIAMDQYDFLGIYGQSVDKLRKWYPDALIVVQSVLPMLLSWIDVGGMENINGVLRDLAKQAGVEYLDIYSFFVDGAGNPNAACFLPDGVHLSEEGYAVWSKVVEDFLKSKEVF